jgi:hypothetical protein
MAVPPATALHMGYPCMIPACQHYPAMLLPLALSHLESSACISAEGSVSHPVCGSQTVSLQKEKDHRRSFGRLPISDPVYSPPPYSPYASPGGTVIDDGWSPPSDSSPGLYY